MLSNIMIPIKLDNNCLLSSIILILIKYHHQKDFMYTQILCLQNSRKISERMQYPNTFNWKKVKMTMNKKCLCLLYVTLPFHVNTCMSTQEDILEECRSHREPSRYRWRCLQPTAWTSPRIVWSWVHWRRPWPSSRTSRSWRTSAAPASTSVLVSTTLYSTTLIKLLSSSI